MGESRKQWFGECSEPRDLGESPTVARQLSFLRNQEAVSIFGLGDSRRWLASTIPGGAGFRILVFRLGGVRSA